MHAGASQAFFVHHNGQKRVIDIPKTTTEWGLLFESQTPELVISTKKLHLVGDDAARILGLGVNEYITDTYREDLKASYKKDTKWYGPCVILDTPHRIRLWSGRGFRPATERSIRYRAKQYKMSVEEMRALLAPGVCHLCGAQANCVDHDHDTDRVRGLLCHDCNMTIGHVDRLRRLGVVGRAIVYSEGDPERRQGLWKLLEYLGEKSVVPLR